MSRSYFTDDMKLVKRVKPLPLWTPEQCITLEDMLYKKGYLVSVSSCIDHNGTLCNCWKIERGMAGFFVEEIMKRRMIVEVEPRPHYRADIIFVCRDPFLNVKRLVKNIPKWREDL